MTLLMRFSLLLLLLLLLLMTCVDCEQHKSSLTTTAPNILANFFSVVAVQSQSPLTPIQRQARDFVFLHEILLSKQKKANVSFYAIFRLAEIKFTD